jgi:hypothetical protein
LFLWLFLWVSPVLAQPPVAVETRYLADIELETSAEFVELLNRASQLLGDGVVDQDGLAKVAFVLHGPVILDFLRQNYMSRRAVVDLAASLTALQVVEIKVCRSWMDLHGVNEDDLQPFVETVSLGRREVERLRLDKQYLDF